MTRHLILPALFAALLAGCESAPTSGSGPGPSAYYGVPATSIVATVTCSDPATKFSGTIVADGFTTEYSGTGSGTYRASGHKITCSFKKTTPGGQIKLSVTEDGQDLGNSTSSEKSGGVRGEIVNSRQGSYQVFTTF
jgi:hypothetical protein